MRNNTKILWIVTIIFTLLTAYFQRRTGPTKPIRDTVVIQNEKISYKLIRSATTGTTPEILILTENKQLNGIFRYKRFKSYDEWAEVPMVQKENGLAAYIPSQPPAGKVMYQIIINDNEKKHSLTQAPVIIRFKGDVPLIYLLPHIIFMFIAMLYSNRAGLGAIFNTNSFSKLSFITLLSLIVGGLIFGPLVQKFAFGAYWTGFPFGHDLTDNKTAVAVIFWIIATYKSVRKSTHSRWWVLTAAIVLLLTYMIPHSMLGSELDYTKMP